MLQLGEVLAGLPVPIVIDHCGGVKAELGTAHPQFQALLRLLDSGNAWVKICSYRVSSTGAPFADAEANVKALVAAAPERCVWGTDWPHPGLDPVPDTGTLFDQFCAWLPMFLRVSKMDLVNFSEEVFNQIVEEYKEFASRLDVPDIRFIPVSALLGDNVVDKSANMPWYDGAPLLSTLDNNLHRQRR